MITVQCLVIEENVLEPKLSQNNEIKQTKSQVKRACTVKINFKTIY